MHCIRRAALRATLSASRQYAPKAAATQSIAASVLKMTASVQGPTIAARCFSQTTGRSDEEFSNSPEANGDRAQSQMGSETEHGIFVRNIAFTTTVEQLKSAFEKFGTVAGASIARDGRGMSRGYGFVYYEEADAKKTAIAEVDGSFWHGRRVNVLERTGGLKADRRETPKTPSETLFIGNIPYDATDAELTRLFRELPNVQDIRVAVDRTTGWPRGFAHVSFADIASAEAAKARLSETELHGRQLRIDFSEGVKNRSGGGEDLNDFNKPRDY